MFQSKKKLWSWNCLWKSKIVNAPTESEDSGIYSDIVFWHLFSMGISGSNRWRILKWPLIFWHFQFAVLECCLHNKKPEFWQTTKIILVDPIKVKYRAFHEISHPAIGDSTSMETPWLSIVNGCYKPNITGTRLHFLQILLRSPHFQGSPRRNQLEILAWWRTILRKHMPQSLQSLLESGLPSGKHTKSYGKSQFLIGKSSNYSWAIFHSCVSLLKGRYCWQSSLPMGLTFRCTYFRNASHSAWFHCKIGLPRGLKPIVFVVHILNV